MRSMACLAPLVTSTFSREATMPSAAICSTMRARRSARPGRGAYCSVSAR